VKFVFVGAVESSETALAALLSDGLVPDLVVTLPEDRSHRHSDYADIAKIAKEAGIAVHVCVNINDEVTLNAVRSVAPDLCVVVGWSQICNADFRAIARIGTIGFHPSDLPRMRGRAVIPWTILSDQKQTGSSLFWIDEGADTGDILQQKTFDVAPDETARSLYEKHKANIRVMVPEGVREAMNSTGQHIPQNHDLATFCAKRTEDDGQIDWSLSAAMILRQIRATGDPYPGSFTYSGNQRVYVLQANPFPQSSRYIGLTGQVQAFVDGQAIVRCGDGLCIAITEWHSASSLRLRVHETFGSVLPEP
jgi:methionyl-tRNA formyltransferase